MLSGGVGSSRVGWFIVVVLASIVVACVVGIIVVGVVGMVLVRTSFAAIFVLMLGSVA